MKKKDSIQMKGEQKMHNPFAKSSAENWVILKRDCPAVSVPGGKDILLYAGTEVRITQALGGTFTVVTHQHAMASLSGKDADALGLEVPREYAASALDKPVDEQVMLKLRSCYDPEIAHNIVDLGLIYRCDVENLPGRDEEYKVEILMTLTAPGCGMGDWIKRDAEQKILTIPAVKECRIELTFDPPWSPAKMNPALRRELY